MASEKVLPFCAPSPTEMLDRDFPTRLRQSLAADTLAKNLAEIHQGDVLHRQADLRSWHNLTDGERTRYQKAARLALLLLDPERCELAVYAAMIALEGDQQGTDGSRLGERSTTTIARHYFVVTSVWRSMQSWLSGTVHPQQEAQARTLRAEFARRRVTSSMTDPGALPDVRRAIEAETERSEVDRLAPIDGRD